LTIPNQLDNNYQVSGDEFDPTIAAWSIPMMTRDERLRYLEKIEAAQSALLADPEVAAEYAQASQAWDSTIGPAIVEDRPEKQSSTNRRPTDQPRS
jgi:hypothetical protein